MNKLFPKRKQVDNGNNGLFLNETSYAELDFDPIEIDYLINRIDDQIKWYDNKSLDAKRKSHITKLIVIISSAVIPVLTNIGMDSIYMKITISLVGAFISICEGNSSLKKYSENWIEYRRVCETLKHEKFMFIYKSGIYQKSNNDFNYFVERTESIISQENLNWASLNNTKGDK